MTKKCEMTQYDWKPQICVFLIKLFQKSKGASLVISQGTSAFSVYSFKC